MSDNAAESIEEGEIVRIETMNVNSLTHLQNLRDQSEQNIINIKAQYNRNTFRKYLAVNVTLHLQLNKRCKTIIKLSTMA